ncbi:FecR family protein [Brucellaceae bacterium C25G]
MTNDKTAASHNISNIEKEAIAWFTRMHGKPTSLEKSDFAKWLKRSPDHQRAYADLRSLWSDVGVVMENVANKRHNDLQGSLQKIKEFRRKKSKAAKGAVITSCFALFVMGAWLWIDHPYFIQNWTADYITEKAERRSVTLADGSTVLMDADTALEVDLSDRGRRVHILRGGAYFAVERTGAPFVVRAGNGEVRVLGTQFDVVMNEDDNVTVTLSHGSVEVSSVDDVRKVVLKPGESVDYGNAGLGAVKVVNINESMAWHEGRLIFNNARLADVLSQIKRYRDGRIVLLGSSIGDKRVSGNISLENTETALTAMQSSVGFRMTKLGGKVVLIGP